MIRFAFAFWLLLAGAAQAGTRVDLTFPADVSVLNSANVSHSSAENADFTSGVAVINAASGSDRPHVTWDECTVGYTRVSVDLKVVDTYTDLGTELTWFYVLPAAANVDTATSANGSAVFWVSRDTANPEQASTAYYRLGHRAGASFTQSNLIRRGCWNNVEVIIDHTAETYDVYIDGFLFIKDAACPNAASVTNSPAASFMMLGTSSNGNVQVGRIFVENGLTVGQPSERLLVSHDFTTSAAGEIEDQYPDVDFRHVDGFSQKWETPTDTTTYGGITISSTGAAGDAAKDCVAFIRGTCDGADEIDALLSSSGDRGFSLYFRNWAGLGSDSYCVVDYDSGRTAGTQLQLRQGSTVLQQSAGTSGSVTYNAGEIKKVRVEYRGTYMQAYVDDVLQLTHQVVSSGTGARGQLSEETVGFGFNTNNVDAGNKVLRFRHYGDLSTDDRRVVIDGVRWGMMGAGVPEMIVEDSDYPTTNLFWSKGIQENHISKADRGYHRTWVSELYQGAKLYSIAHRGNCWVEDKALYATDAISYTTLTPRGAYVRESLLYTKNSSENFAPDYDFRGRYHGNVVPWTYRMANGTIGHGSRTKSFTTWQSEFTGRGSGAFQFLTTGTNKVMHTGAVCHVTGTADNVLILNTKREGNGDPFSIAFAIPPSAMSAGGTYALTRVLYLDTGASVAASDTFRAALLDDLEQPATLSVSVGTINTGATGDVLAGGFNRWFGWYELEAANNAVSFAFDGVCDRVRPQFHIEGMSIPAFVFVDGVLQVEGTDYWVTDDGETGIVLGFTGTLADDAKISISRQRFPIVRN